MTFHYALLPASKFFSVHVGLTEPSIHSDVIKKVDLLWDKDDAAVHLALVS